MLPENPTFMIRGDDGLEYGPVDLDELRDWVQENRAGIGTDVRRDEPGASWQPWQTHPELVALLAEVHATAGEASPALASMGRRIIAFALDLLLATILSLPPVYLITYKSGMPDLEQRFLTSILQPDSPVTPQVLFYGWLCNFATQVTLVLYFACFIAASGQTPGKALLRLRVVDKQGQKPYFVKALLRALALIVSTNLLFLPLAYAFFDPRRRALHDFIAGTYVVEA